MEWTYRIRAAAQPRTLMRVAQVFDQQMVSMRRCLLEETGDFVEIAITVETEEALAVRIHAKLYKLLDLLQVDLIAGRSLIVALGERPVIAAQRSRPPKAEE